MKLQVEVTQQDIEHGVKQDCGRCPVALALRRALRKQETYIQEVIVHGNDIVVIYKNKGYRTLTPQNITHFINWFDTYGSLAIYAVPFTFELEFDGLEAV